MVVITQDGEIWIRHHSNNKAIETSEFEILLSDLCPNGTGAFVPCSNGEGIPSYLILYRVSDPYWIGYNGEYRFETPKDQIINDEVMDDPVVVEKG